jgi:hypothetical protein
MATVNLIDTTFTAKNISSAISVYEYTATGTMRLRFQVRLYQVAGGGDYTINLRLNDGDALADDPMVPKTTYTAAAGAQNVWFQSGVVDVLVDDVINVMVLGQAGDTAVVGSIRIFSEDATAVSTLADDAITSAKFDESTAFPVKSADSGSTQIARKGADSDTLETLSDQIDLIPSLGSGSTSWVYNLKDGDGNNVADATIRVTSDSAGATLLAIGMTDADGNVTFHLTSGATVYVWATKPGYNNAGPDTEVVS